jgi:hypothetical protein
MPIASATQASSCRVDRVATMRSDRAAGETLSRRRWEPFLCLYCGQGMLAVQPSVAHIIPDVIGGITAPDDTTCIDCNGVTNHAFEQTVARRLEPFRNMWGIMSRRGAVPKVTATATIDGQDSRIRVTDPSDPEVAVVHGVKSADGRKTYSVLGRDEAVEKKKRDIDAKTAGVVWREGMANVELTVDIESTPDAPEFLRLAAKIALERLADLRGPGFVRDGAIAGARTFVLTGNASRPIAGVVYDPAWMDREAALSFPIPVNAVVLVSQPIDRLLGAVVVLFGLYHYWVVLAEPYDGLAPWDDLLKEDPQTGRVEAPMFRSGTGSLRLPWARWREASATRPDEVRRAVMANVLRKLQAAADAFYGPDDEGGHA